jgi:hypothetical protein
MELGTSQGPRTACSQDSNGEFTAAVPRPNGAFIAPAIIGKWIGMHTSIPPRGGREVITGHRPANLLLAGGHAGAVAHLKGDMTMRFTGSDDLAAADPFGELNQASCGSAVGTPESSRP